MLPLWHDAASLAARAHERQVRKDGRTPYASHPFRVALTVASMFGCRDETVLAAALLHDTIEDAGLDYDDLLEGFGPGVADLVAALTKDARLAEPEREVAYDAQLAAAAPAARLIKLADVHDNLNDAADEPARRKLLDKARRALALTHNDGAFAEARRIVSALVDEVERALEEARR